MQTVDYFPPIVDDPFVYGQIAAANALSDVYAMGGVPKTALSIVGFPAKGVEFAILGDIMNGGLNKLQEAGVALLGGHSVRDEEIKFGFAVTGIIQPQNIKKNAGGRSGDRLILTKRLGTGLITTAAKRGKSATEHVDAAISTMLQLNRRASEIAVQFDVHTMTDITGFGLVGHVCEVARASHLTVHIDHSKLQFLPGVLEYSRAGFCSAGLTSNQQYFGVHVSMAESIPLDVRNVLFDPQTSGGLLIFCQPENAKAVLDSFAAESIEAVEVGFTSDAADHLLTVT